MNDNTAQTNVIKLVPETGPIADTVKRHEGTVKMLKFLLEKAEKGELVGGLMVMETSDDSTFTCASDGCSTHLMIAGIEMVKYKLLRLAASKDVTFVDDVEETTT